MKSDGDTRKVQFTGKSSYIVSLPKDWIRDLGIKQGDQVLVSRQGISSLVISPIESKKKEDGEIAVLEIQSSEETSTVVRKLVALYFLDFKTIKIKPKTGRISPAHRVGIRDSVKKILMGSEITADSIEGITVQILINPVELSVDGAFKRMMLLAKSMQDDALLAIKERNKELATEVINSDDDVDRFGFYITRQLAIAIENDHMLKEMGFVNARDCLGYRVIIKNIERLGDHATKIVKDVFEHEKALKENTFNKIQEMSDFAVNTVDDACLALFTRDYIKAENSIIASQDIEKYEKKITDTLKKSDDEEVFRVRRIIENIRRIAEYASDIGEIVLNMNVEKTLKKK